jgi:hypothetical protein
MVNKTPVTEKGKISFINHLIKASNKLLADKQMKRKDKLKSINELIRVIKKLIKKPPKKKALTIKSKIPRMTKESGEMIGEYDSRPVTVAHPQPTGLIPPRVQAPAPVPVPAIAPPVPAIAPRPTSPPNIEEVFDIVTPEQLNDGYSALNEQMRQGTIFLENIQAQNENLNRRLEELESEPQSAHNMQEIEAIEEQKEELIEKMDDQVETIKNIERTKKALGAAESKVVKFQKYKLAKHKKLARQPENIRKHFSALADVYGQTSRAMGIDTFISYSDEFIDLIKNLNQITSYKLTGDEQKQFKKLSKFSTIKSTTLSSQGSGERLKKLQAAEKESAKLVSKLVREKRTRREGDNPFEATIISTVQQEDKIIHGHPATKVHDPTEAFSSKPNLPFEKQPIPENPEKIEKVATKTVEIAKEITEEAKKLPPSDSKDEQLEKATEAVETVAKSIKTILGKKGEEDEGHETETEEEEEEETTGGGTFEDTYNKAPSEIKKLLTNFGDYKITKLQIIRRPIESALIKLSNILSMGKVVKSMKKKHIDEFYHLGFQITAEHPDDKDQVHLLLERYTRVGVEYIEKPQNFKNDEFINIPIHKNITLAEFIINGVSEGQKKHPHYWIYNFETNNCQDFVMDMMTANNLWQDRRWMQWVKQPIQNVFPKWMGKHLITPLTNIGTRLDVWMNGQGRIRGGEHKGLNLEHRQLTKKDFKNL